MSKLVEGILSAKEKKFAIVVSRFNDFVSLKLLAGAEDCLIRHQCRAEDITVVKVPGAFEIPLAAYKLASSKKFNAIICLGAVIRGATPHFDYVAAEVSKGIASASLETGVPCSFGVLTTDNLEQAIERAGSKSGNKGWDAAMSAIEMASLLTKLGK